MKKTAPIAVLWMAAASTVFAGKLVCPDSLNDPQARDVMATSAPEIKVRASIQNDGKRWAETVRPLIQKAIKQAKLQRATYIQEGIERGCTFPEQYVGQIIPVPEKPSGCDHRVVTRPAEENHVFVQVVAVCKYDWACCTPEIEKPKAGSGESAHYSIEGPLSPNTPTSSKSKH